jgi:anti-sigma B factor antagonist
MFNVDLSISDFDGQAVVALRGESNPADIPDVASHLIAAVAACGPSVIVDLAGLEGIDYSGLSVLLRIRKWTRQNGGDLPLAALQQPVRQLLEATGLIDVFSIYASVQEAANSLRQARAWSPAPRRPSAAMVIKPNCRRRACRYTRHSLVRPMPRRGTCRLRHTPFNASVKWCSPGGRTAWSAWI